MSEIDKLFKQAKFIHDSFSKVSAGYPAEELFTRAVLGMEILFKLVSKMNNPSADVSDQAGSISTVTQTEIIRACNLAGLPYTDWQKIRCYLPVFADGDTQSPEDKT